MPNMQDLTGREYGDYIVVGFDNTKGKYKYYWNCKCQKCGEEKSIAYTSLTRNKSVKCKCNSKYNTPDNLKGFSVDLSGQKFGKLTVLKYAGKKNSHSLWLCRCECGKEVEKDIGFLKRPTSIKMCEDCQNKNNTLENVLNDGEVVSHTKKENNYEFVDDYVVINGKIFIDVSDFDLINRFHRYVSVNSGKYAYMRLKNDNDIFLHRLLMGLPPRFDDKDTLIVDHINGNTLDNRKANLRVVKKELNPINCRIYNNNTSGCKGVSFLKRLNKWQAEIHIDNKGIYLGVYESFDEAVKVRKAAEEKYFGEMNRKDDEQGILQLP